MAAWPSWLVQVLVVMHVGDADIFMDTLVEGCVDKMFEHVVLTSFEHRAPADMHSTAFGKLRMRRTDALVPTWAGHRTLQQRRRCTTPLCPPPGAGTGGRVGGRGFLKKAGLELPKVIEKRGKELGTMFSALAISLCLLVGFDAFSPELLAPQPAQPQLSAVAYVQPEVQSSAYSLDDATAEPAIVIDMAGVLSDEQRAFIVKESRSLRKQTGADIAVFTETELARDAASTQQQAAKILNDWGLGNPEKGNGVLIQLIKDRQSLKVVLGSGLDESYGQFRGWFSVVQQDKIVKLMQDGREGEALVKTVRDYAQMVRNVDKLGDYVTNTKPRMNLGVGAAAVTLISASSGAIVYLRSKQCDNELRARLTEKLGPEAINGARLLRYTNMSELIDPRDQTEAQLGSAVHGFFRAKDGREVIVGWPRVFCTYDRCSDCGAWAYQPWGQCLNCNQGVKPVLTALTGSSPSNVDVDLLASLNDDDGSSGSSPGSEH